MRQSGTSQNHRAASAKVTSQPPNDLPGQVLSQFIQEPGMFLRPLDNWGFAARWREFLHFFIEGYLGSIQLCCQLLVALGTNEQIYRMLFQFMADYNVHPVVLIQF